jgi:hypothetical protein
MDKSLVVKANNVVNGSSVSPMRSNPAYQPSATQGVSRNTSHRSSSSSFVHMVKSSENFKEKEKRYIEKVKGLKSENKKLMTLLRDSERLFY